MFETTALIKGSDYLGAFHEPVGWALTKGTSYAPSKKQMNTLCLILREHWLPGSHSQEPSPAPSLCHRFHCLRSSVLRHQLGAVYI